MTYSDFSLETIDTLLGLNIQRIRLFPTVVPLALPPELRTVLDMGKELALISEKARSEFIVAPILLSLRLLSHNRIAIYSGQRLDVDAARGLVGECDFILTDTPPLPIVQAPIVTILEAKKNDIENGLGQCAAQMVGAVFLNQRKDRTREAIFGCVTTGETWQFLRLTDTTLAIDSQRYYIDQVETILGVLAAMVALPVAER